MIKYKPKIKKTDYEAEKFSAGLLAQKTKRIVKIAPEFDPHQSVQVNYYDLKKAGALVSQENVTGPSSPTKSSQKTKASELIKQHD